MNIHNPYDGGGLWLKGCIHAHTTKSDGRLTPAELMNRYSQHDYDFLAITDHDKMTTAKHPSLLMVPSVEITLPEQRHLLSIGSAVQPNMEEETQDCLARIEQSGGLAVAAHPNQDLPHPGFRWPVEALTSLRGLHGLEIYNHLASLFFPRGLAVDVWDKLLSSGVYPCWGFAVDDTHGMSDSDSGPIRDDIFGGWIVVGCPERTLAALLTSIRRGSFYASTGVTILEVNLSATTLTVSSADAEYVRFIGHAGRVLAEKTGMQGSYTIQGSEHYVRVECYREDGTTAWTQPLLVSQGA